MAVREVPVSGHLAGTGAQELRNLQAWQSAGTPAAATSEGVFWYDTNSGNKRLYFRDNAGAVPVPRLDRAETVTGQWTVAPGSTQPPFVLGANAQGQKVVGLNADQLDGRDSSTNPTANTIGLRDSNGRLTAEDPVALTDLVNLQYLNDSLSFLTISASQVTSGLLALARGGSNADLSAAATGGLIYRGASALAATAALSGVLVGNGASAPSALAQVTVALGGTGAATAAGARTNLDVPSNEEMIGWAAGRAPRGGLSFDGSSNWRLAGSAGMAIGTQDFSIFTVVRFHDYTPNPAVFLWSSHSNLGNNNCRLSLQPTGALILTFVNSGGSAASYTLTPDAPLVDGRTYGILVSVDRDGNASLFINTVADRDFNGAAVTVDVSGSASVDIGSGNANPWGAANGAIGEVMALTVFNYAVSPADAGFLMRRGLSAQFSDQWGSASLAYTSNFTVGANNWTTDAAGSQRQVTGNVDAVGGEDNWLKLENLTTTNLYGYHTGVVMEPGKRYRIKGRFFVPTGSPVTHVGVMHTGSQSFANTSDNAKKLVAVPANTITAFEAEIVTNIAAYTLFSVVNSTGTTVNYDTSAVLYVKDITIQKIGAICDLDLQNANPAYSTTVRDRSSHGYHATVSASQAWQTNPVSQLNAGLLLANNLTANTVVYAGTGGLLSSVTANASGTRHFLSQVSSGAPAFFDLFGGSNTWTGDQVFSGPVAVPTPTLGSHAATKAYVDSAVSSGLRVLASCSLATTANVTLSGEQTIDGVLTSGSRVLVKNQSTASQNGIYVTSSGAWSRATDANDAAELTAGAYTYITSGSANAGTSWSQTQTVATVGSDSVQWQLFFQQAAYASGTGISITGLTLAINQAASLAWTGTHSFTNSGGVQLLPHGTSTGNTTELRFYELAANGTHYVSFRAPDSLAATLNFRWPSADGGSGHVLKTNGAGVLSFAQITSGEIDNSTFVTSVTGTAGRISVSGTLAVTVDIDANYAGQDTITTVGIITNAGAIWRGTPIEVGYGGTNLSSYTAGDLIYAADGSTLAKRGIGSAGTFLQSLSGVPNWSGYSMPATVGANQLLYASSSSVVSALASVASRVLTTDGSGALAWRNTLPPGLTVEGDSDSKIVKMRWFNVGNGTDTNITLTHGYGTNDVVVKLYENSSGDSYREYPLVPLSRPTTNTVQLEFITAPTSGQFRACVMAQI